ncbi:organic cation transporter-like protein [Physella acuta]|uniref:organic cation transporter-like protein n=1 Tax=Physella acuta TaxID=109671 RepID=UPI0027DB5B26|nr:organic cation transporter-like protein [Physella acuta]XP_059168763.1 organic cation transporter-like protein [Physella acuta]
MDGVLKSLNTTGRHHFHHVIQVVLISLAICSGTLQLLSYIFTCQTVPHSCVSPKTKSNETDDQVNVTSGQCDVTYWKNRTAVKQEACLDGYDFHLPVERSAVSQFELVCDRSNLARLSQTLVIAGQGVGAIIATFFSDRWGRKTVLVISNFGLGLFGVCIAISPSYIYFAVFKFIVGAFEQGVIINSATLMLELMTTGNRKLSAAIIGVVISFSAMLLALVSFFLREYSWRILQIALSTSSIFVILQIFNQHFGRYLDESLRWMVANGKINQALVVISRAARMNKCDEVVVLKIFQEQLKQESCMKTLQVLEPKSLENWNKLESSFQEDSGRQDIEAQQNNEQREIVPQKNSDQTKILSQKNNDQTKTLSQKNNDHSKTVSLKINDQKKTLSQKNNDQTKSLSQKNNDEEETLSQRNNEQEKSLSPQTEDQQDSACQPNKDLFLSENVLSGRHRFDGVSRCQAVNEHDWVSNKDENSHDAQMTDLVSSNKEEDSLDAQMSFNKDENSHDAQMTKHERMSFFDLVKQRQLFVSSVVAGLLWFTTAVGYFGIYFTSTTFVGNRFLNFFLTALMEIPSNLMLYSILDRFGRRISTGGAFAILGISVLASGICRHLQQVYNDDIFAYLALGFSLLGMLGASSCFGIVFLYTPEMFPTNIRNRAMGVASCVGRLGGMLAPFLGVLAEQAIWLSGLLIASLCTLVCLTLRFLPETNGRELPQSLQELKRW